MLDQFIYENHLGQRFDGLANGVYLNTSELRNYTWSYQTINSRISRFYRKTTNRKIPLFVVGQSDAQAIEAMNRLFDVTEADIATHIPGKVFVGEYYTTGFVTVSKKTEFLQSKQLCKLEITLTSDDPAWYRDQVHSFYTDASTPKAAKSGDAITVSNVPASPVRGITLYGKTTQNGTPSPSAPISLVTVGADGNVKVSAKSGMSDEGGNEYIKIITQPRNVTATLGTSVVFSVAASGAGLAYQWQYSTPAGGWVDSGQTGSKTDSLTIAAESHRDGYKYRCRITDANGRSVTSYEATLSIGDATAYDNPVTVQTATITTASGLPGVPVSSGGNYTDEDGQMWFADFAEYNADAGTAKRVRKNAHFTSESEYGTPYKNGNEAIWRVQPVHVELPNKGYPLALCSRYVRKSSYGNVKDNNGSIAITADGLIILRDDALTDAAAVTAMLTSGDFELIYPLAEPVETDLTTSEFYALRMQSPNTTLYNEDGAFMDVVYSTVENTSGSAVGGFDYPYEYDLEYGVQTGGRNITNDTFTGNAFRILIYGAVINPTITIGGHAYTVNGAVGEGETLTIDSMTKTITLTTANGTKINYFDKRDRQNYIFQPIQPGQNAVTWSGDFGFELTVIEERSEPKWT